MSEVRIFWDVFFTLKDSFKKQKKKNLGRNPNLYNPKKTKLKNYILRVIYILGVSFIDLPKNAQCLSKNAKTQNRNTQMRLRIRKDKIR